MNPVALAVDDLREQYTREMALVRQTCERTGDGTAAIRRRSAVVDRILIEMWRRAFAGQPAPERTVSADDDPRLSSKSEGEMIFKAAVAHIIELVNNEKENFIL